MSKVCIELGCGDSKKPGIIGIDRAKLEGVDIIADLSYGIPLKDSTVDYTYSSNFIEHIPDFLFIVEEMHRVSKPDALIHILVPYFNCFDAHTDPTHKIYFTERTFDYFSDSIKFNWYSKAKFKILKKKLLLNPQIRNRIFRFFLPEKYLKVIFDAYNQVEFKLKVVK